MIIAILCSQWPDPVLKCKKRVQDFHSYRLTYRSNYSKMFFKIGVLKNFTICTGKHLFWSLILIKLQTWRPAALLKRDSNTGAFLRYLRNFWDYLFYGTPPVSASDLVNGTLCFAHAPTVAPVFLGFKKCFRVKAKSY